MAEAIAVVASIIAVIQISDRLVGLVKTCIEASKDAPKDFRVILNEISTLKIIFENLEFLIRVDGSKSTLLPRLEGPAGPIEGCQSSITELTNLITPGFEEPDTRPKKKRKTGTDDTFADLKHRASKFYTRLAWPLKETKARKILEDIARYKATINLALSNEAAYVFL